jgi:hypothetical protein
VVVRPQVILKPVDQPRPQNAGTYA